MSVAPWVDVCVVPSCFDDAKPLPWAIGVPGLDRPPCGARWAGYFACYTAEFFSSTSMNSSRLCTSSFA